MIEEGIRVIDQIIDKLFGKYEVEHKRLIDNLCDQMGRDESGRPSIGFVYNGAWHPRPNQPNVHRKNATRHGLPSHLVPMMDKAERELTLVNSEKKQINQLLVKLLYQCNDVEEIRDALPDCLWVYGGFSSHERKFTLEHFFWNDTRVQADYQRLLPRIEYYLGMSLIL